VDARVFHDQVVLPNVADLNADYGDLRRAMNAVLSVDALAAHIFDWCRRHVPSATLAARDDSNFRELLAQQNADFGLLRDIAKALKHVTLTRGQPQVRGAAMVASQSLGWGEMRWGEGRWGSPLQVVVELNDGSFRVVEAVVAAALAFLQAEMARLGI
jgi:hypothetical protein